MFGWVNVDGPITDLPSVISCDLLTLRVMVTQASGVLGCFLLTRLAAFLKLIHNAVFREQRFAYADIDSRRFVPVGCCSVLLSGVWWWLNL